MLVAIVTDTHWGAKNDNTVVQDYFASFYRDVFFPELKSRGIKTIIHGGDVFDRRKFVNFLTLKKANEEFLDLIGDYDMDMHVILGNHDCYFKNTNQVNALAELLFDKKGIKVYQKPTDVQFGSLRIMMLPWLTPENTQTFLTHVNNSTSDWLVGHLELEGYEMHKGQACEHGMNASVFKNFEQVLTGHFHTQSEKGNIRYLGAPYEMTWIDFEDPKGFHILDTEKRTLEFIPNPNKMFMKVYYNDTAKPNLDDYKNSYGQKMVKLIVEDRKNHALFDSVVAYINEQTPLNFTIVEDLQLVVEENGDAIKNAEKDTLTFIDEFIDDIQTNKDTSALKKIMKNLYNEVQQ